eukprot:CAMPEP_0174873372 /NCGR_PEP_ID=MMETSP1114-20130205/74778_1 /TAXON_ID=312471 /ORGANISM="Neobodo designis, Strain CCAP 1951/1" /LENGTH=118 /DNA_ID=CAMNT_0016108687 /DNA_START=36 /DNA_END=388 /DNA_ORIENTATION=+
MPGKLRVRGRASGTIEPQQLRTRAQAATAKQMAKDGEPAELVRAYERRTNLLNDVLPEPMPADSEKEAFEAVKNRDDGTARIAMGAVVGIYDNGWFLAKVVGVSQARGPQNRTAERST